MTDVTANHPPTLAEGSVVADRYRIERMLGQGAMGAVYLATHVHMRKRFALKLLLPDVRDSQEVLARFEREAMAAAHIEHPNVVAATDFGRTPDGAFFLVLEYVEGDSLRTVLANGPVAPQRAARIARQIASALGRAHSLGIVHRDLKPDNVMLVKRDGADELVKVLDFGIAKVNVNQLSEGAPRTTKHALTQVGSVFGTPEYMAPEQALGESVDARTDLYALGVTLYEMLAGLRPLEADNAVVLLTMHVTTPPPPISVRNPNVTVPPELEALTMRLLAKKPADRPASAQEVETALADIFAPSSGLVPAPPSSSSGWGDAAAAWSGQDAVAKTHLPESSLPIATSPLVKVQRASQTALAKARTVLAILSDRLPPPARRFVPAALAGLAALFALVVIVAVWPRGDTKTITSADGGTATVASAKESSSWTLFKAKLSDEKIGAAADGGVPALSALLREFPDDPRVLRAIVREHGMRGELLLAMQTLDKLGAVNPKAAEDAEMLNVLEAAALADATSLDAALALADGPFGPPLVDILIDGTAKAGPTKNRLMKALARPEVRARASPGAAVTLELREAKSCDARRALLPRAREAGDARTLAAIEVYKRTRGCGILGAFDCYSCMRGDTLLDDTITALGARVGRPPR